MLKKIIAVIVVLTCTLIACSGGGDSQSLEPLSPEVRQAAEALLKVLSVNSTSEVTVIGPIPGGTMLLENSPAESVPQALGLPTAEGTYYAFFIDDEPNRDFEHPIRFGWLELESLANNFTEGSNEIFLSRPINAGDEPQPFTRVGFEEIEGVPTYHVAGDGIPIPEDISHKGKYLKKAAHHLKMHLFSTAEREAPQVTAPKPQREKPTMPTMSLHGLKVRDFPSQESVNTGAMA